MNFCGRSEGVSWSFPPPARIAGLTAMAIAAGAAAPRLAAQPGAGTDAALRGVVLSARARTGLPAAEIILLRGGDRPVARTVTDSAGRFLIDDLEAGSYRIRIRHVGRTTGERAVRLRATETKTIELRVAMPALTIEDLEVTVEGSPVTHRLRGFEKRRKRGHGYFIGPERIRQMQPRQASDVLRNVPGLRIGPDGRAEVSVSGGRSARRCEPSVWLDGQELRGYRINNLEPGDLLAVEVFRGRAEIPSRFWRREGQCAAIVLWTREGRGPGDGGDEDGERDDRVRPVAGGVAGLPTKSGAGLTGSA